ncbi:MAG: hypothetical protein JWQ09_4229 [Segetibacter sp.]|nr:hypothetical protein [Segetibacter sp.]
MAFHFNHWQKTERHYKCIQNRRMRIWSVHPKYLDPKGLVALWRETLLAKHVLEGKTKGYKNHPQLDRFKATNAPVDTINQYLAEIYKEASNRGYNFDKGKVNWKFEIRKLTVTTKQFDYEITHLLKKLQERAPKKYNELKSKSTFDTHPLFELIEGEIENWEVLASR